MTEVNEEKDWERCAYHEAGHTVAYFILGYSPYETIVFERWFDDGENIDAYRSGYAAVMDYSRVELPSRLPWPQANLIGLMAGRIGQRFVMELPVEDEDHNCSNDMERAGVHVIEILGNEANESLITTYLGEALQQAHELLHTLEAKKAVKAIAECLLDNRNHSLNRPQMVEIICAASPGLNIETENVSGVPDRAPDTHVKMPLYTTNE